MQSITAARSKAKFCGLVQVQKRSLAYSAPNFKALPFFLNTYHRAQNDREHESGRMLRMLMFGKPGAGKGTLTTRLIKKYDIVALSTGDLLRQHIAEGTEVGREAEEIVACGGLLPDEVMLKIVTSKLDLLHNKHWILDGFPRTLGQGELLDSHLRMRNTPLSLVINLDVPDQVILGRISDRWVHLPSGRVYNMSYNRPKIDGLDDETGEPLTKRPDDNLEVFSRRLSQFYASTSPLLAYYTSLSKSEPARNPHQHPHQLSFHHSSQKLKLRTLSGATSDENWPQLDRLVQTSFPTLKVKTETRDIKRKHSLSNVISSDVGAGAGFQD